MSGTMALSLNHLSKRMQGMPQIMDISLEIQPGEIYGLLGVQGAGKSLLLSMIMDLVRPSIGSIEIFGQRLSPQNNRILAHVGALLDPPGFYEAMSVKENLEIQAAYTGLHDRQRVAEVLHDFSLRSAASLRVRDLPAPTRQRLGLARSILHRPGLLLLDEPFTYLDSMSIRFLSDLLGRLALIHNTAILVTGKQVNELIRVVDRIGILHQGRLLRELPATEVNERVNRRYQIRSTNPQTTLQALDAAGFSSVRLLEDGVVEVADSEIDPDLLVRTLADHGPKLLGLESQQATIEELLLDTVAQEQNRV